MRNSTILGTGFYVPPRVVTNDDLAAMFDTSDEWIKERSGIRERRWVDPGTMSTDMAKIAAERALEDAGMTMDDIDMVIFGTLNPDIHFPGCACLLQSKMEMGNIPALDIRQQCSSFIYASTIADNFIKTGMYDNIMVIGSEIHSTGLEKADRGRDVTVLFGDGAGVTIMGPAASEKEGLLATCLHADGKGWDKLCVMAPYGYVEGRVTEEMIERGDLFTKMDGRTVFKNAVPRFCEAMKEVLDKAGYTIDDVALFTPHQANDRITWMVAKTLGLPKEKVVSNIGKYGNTTAATIPICIHEARGEGRLKKGDLLICASFGAGFTWGALLWKWTLD